MQAAIATPAENVDPPIFNLHMEAASFWFVWTKTGHVPRKAHNSCADAEMEAIRLARQCPGKKFIVLQAVTKFSVAPQLDAVAA